MQVSIVARGFSLTEALRHAVEQEARAFANGFATRVWQVSVRLYDVNGRRGGHDKACLVQARMGKDMATLVATDIDEDMYRAIASAFVKLERGARSALTRSRTLRRRGSARQAIPAGFAIA